MNERDKITRLSPPVRAMLTRAAAVRTPVMPARPKRDVSLAIGNGELDELPDDLPAYVAVMRDGLQAFVCVDPESGNDRPTSKEGK